MADKPDGRWWGLLGVGCWLFAGVFAGWFIVMCFFMYPTPLPGWFRPSVLSTVGAILGLGIGIWGYQKRQ